MKIRSANGMVYFETVDGKQKAFRLDFNAIADLEALLGMGIASLVSEQNVGFNIIRGFYWAGLKFKDRGLTVERAGNFIQNEMNGGRTFDELMEPVTAAMIASGIIDESQQDEDEEGEDTEPKN